MAGLLDVGDGPSRLPGSENRISKCCLPETSPQKATTSSDFLKVAFDKPQARNTPLDHYFTKTSTVHASPTYRLEEPSFSMYDSQITFTLDTICPWTYLAKKRLDAALSQLPADVAGKVNFTLKIAPYQLYPKFGPAQDKYAWYRDAKYLGSEEKTQMFAQLMGQYGAACQIDFKFGGVIADTLQAHRVIQYFQEAGGPTRGNRIVDALYRMYFEEEKDPSLAETLIAACVEAGVDEGEAKRVVYDESEGLMDVKALLRESASNGIDSVPHIVFEGRRRDLTLVGAKDIGDYLKAMGTIAKEST